MSATNKPFISCIVTAFNEGELARVSLQSLLNQSFGDFEVLLVDDGASDETRAVLHGFDDPRIVHIRQSNDGLSSARNRAIINARGEYVCFLDADDSRPPWAFAEMARLARELKPDCVFSPGLLCELRQQVTPFYDQDIFNKLEMRDLSTVAAPGQKLIDAVRLLLAIEPQSANKLVKRSFLEAHKLRFPAGLFFEDIVFHNAVLMNMSSYAITGLPTFTYYRRYGRPQITSSMNTVRFDSISSAANLFDLFRSSQYFHDAHMRRMLLASTFKLIQWCERSTAHSIRWAFTAAVDTLVQQMDERYFTPLMPDIATEVNATAPWVTGALSYLDKYAAKRG